MTDRRQVAPGASAALVRRLLPEIAPGGDAAAERPVTVDQTNTSVVVGDRAIVKWLFPPVPAPHRGVELLRHLGAVGFARTPALLGVEEIDGMVDAVVTEYHPDAADGWDWYIDEVQAWVSIGRPVHMPVLAWATQYGVLAAELHHALATPSPVIPEPQGVADLGPARTRALALLDEALAVTPGAAGERLAGLEARLRGELASFGATAGAAAVVQPVHGDFHAGQLLRVGGQLMVIDLDGDPVADPADRHQRQPVARDVAAMVQAIDHVGRVVDKRLEYRRSDDVQRFIDASIDAALAAYRRRLRELDSPVVFDETLLRPFRLAQELHELVYAVRHLPVWLYVPDAALPALFRPGSADPGADAMDEEDGR